MLGYRVLLIAGLCCVVTSASEWPSPQNLVGFWPLNIEVGSENVADRNGQRLDLNDGVVDKRPGPHGVSSSSYMASDCFRSCLVGHTNFSMSTFEFTLSLYFFPGTTSYNESSGIVSFTSFASFTSSRYELSKFGLYMDKAHKDIMIVVEGYVERILMSASIKMDAWNYLAVTYDKALNRLAFYDEKGRLLDISDNVVIAPTYLPLNLGYTSYAFRGYPSRQSFMAEDTDSLACVMLYAIALQPSEIALLPDVCTTFAPRPEMKGSVTASYLNVSEILLGSLIGVSALMTVIFIFAYVKRTGQC